MLDSLDLPDWHFAGNTLESWLLALGAFLITVALVVGARALIIARFTARVERTHAQLDDFALELVRRTRLYFAAILGVIAATPFLTVSPRALLWERRVIVVASLLQLGRWGTGLLDFWLQRYTQRRITVDAASVTTVRAVVLVGKLLLWSLLFLVALQNFGVNVTALMTGLGIGGVAVALAVQSVLGDIIASLSIVLDKPFVVGDFIIVDDMMGTVEEVGLRTTRIRSLSGEQLILSNADLSRTRIRNYKRMARRRVVFTVSVEYGTTPEQLERAPKVIRELIEALPNAQFDRSHFWSFGESGLLIETVYYVLSPDYGMYMDLQQHLNLEIMRRFRELGINFALPTRALRVRGTAEDGSIRALVRSADVVDGSDAADGDGAQGTLVPAQP